MRHATHKHAHRNGAARAPRTSKLKLLIVIVLPEIVAQKNSAAEAEVELAEKPQACSPTTACTTGGYDAAVRLQRHHQVRDACCTASHSTYSLCTGTSELTMSFVSTCLKYTLLSELEAHTTHPVGSNTQLSLLDGTTPS